MSQQKPTAAVSQSLATLWSIGRLAEASDAQLLARYLLRRDEVSEAAFRILVERHGAMVLNVCRQVLGDGHSAEDAAQAAFLILARKAGSLRIQDTLAPWLYIVARRVSAKAKHRLAVRRTHEQKAFSLAINSQTDSSASHLAGDWEAVHDEVARLPEKYRTLVVLCYFEGLTYEEAARRVNCPVGTVRVRLSRARDRLRPRLERRGLATMALAPWEAFLNTGNPVVSHTPPVLANWVDATVRSAFAFTSVHTPEVETVSAAVLLLSREVLRSMMLSNLRPLAFGLLGLGFVAVVCGALYGQQKRPADPPGLATGSDSSAVSSGPRQSINQELLKSANLRFDAQRAFFEEGRVTIDRLIDASRQIREAETRMSTTFEKKMVAARSHVDRLERVLMYVTEDLERERGSIADLAEVEHAVDQAVAELYDTQQSEGRLNLQSLERDVNNIKKRKAEIRRRVNKPQASR